MTGMEALLRQFVECSSHTADKPGCDAIRDALMAAFPLHPETIRSTRFGDHLLLHAPRPATDGGVLLVGHHDTVFPAGSFAGYRRDGSLARGPGVADMKGGLVVMAFAVRALAEAALLDDVPLSVAIVADEEVGSPEGQPVLRRAARGARAALLFEPSRPGDAIITRRKGTGALDVIFHGLAVHAGNAHDKGASAIWALGKFIDIAQRLTDYTESLTVNIGRIAGGIGKNTVPDRAEAQLDFRFARAADGEGLLARLHAAAESACTEVPGTHVEVQGGISRAPLERCDASADLCVAYAACQRAEGLGDIESPLVGGGSDASTCADAGVPTIDGLGPRGGGFHTVDEHIDLATLVPKTRALIRYLAASAGLSADAALARVPASALG
jgi:glutamate carboxypeptidase